MGQTARLRLIRDRFIIVAVSYVGIWTVCHRRLPSRILWTDVGCGRVMRIWRLGGSGPEPVYPAYVVSESDKGADDLRVATVASPQSTPDQVENFFRRLPRPRSQLRFRSLRWWKGCCSIWWRRLRCDNLFRRWRPDRRD